MSLAVGATKDFNVSFDCSNALCTRDSLFALHSALSVGFVPNKSENRTLQPDHCADFPLTAHSVAFYAWLSAFVIVQIALPSPDYESRDAYDHFGSVEPMHSQLRSKCFS